MSFYEERADSQQRSGVRLGWKRQLVETLVFLFLVVPSLGVSLFVSHPNAPQIGFALVAILLMLRDLGLIALIWYFLWRNGEPVGRIGWRWRHLGRELLLGGLLFAPFFFATMGIGQLFLWLGLSGPPPGAD